MRRQPHGECAALLWLACWTALCHANTTLAEDIQNYDFLSLGIAFAAGLFGGLGRSVISLLRKSTLVGDARFLLLRDLGVSAVTGAMVYLLLQGWNELTVRWTSLPYIGKDLRLLLLLVGGYAPNWAFATVHKAADAAVKRAHKAIRGDDSPITEVAPLDGK